jgi:hypothetical protein
MYAPVVSNKLNCSAGCLGEGGGGGGFLLFPYKPQCRPGALLCELAREGAPHCTCILYHAIQHVEMHVIRVV